MIVLVRHGRTEANAAGLLLGRADPPLDDVGRAQAAALGATLAAEPAPVAVVTSPLQRARGTAAAIADACGVDVEVEVDARLLEVDYGEWDGRPFADLPRDVVVRWRADAGFTPPGGESLADVGARVADCASDLLARAGDGRIVAVSHVSPIKAAVAWALGAGQDLAWRLRLDVASITRVARGPATPVLLTFNETAHLA